MLYIVSTEKEYLYSVDPMFKVYTDKVDENELHCKELIWEACDKDLFDLHIYVKNDEDCYITSRYLSIYDLITSCCLLESLTVVTKKEYASEFEIMLKGFSDLKTELKIIDPICYREDKPLCLSVKPCVKNVPTQIKYISLAFHNLHTLKRHELISLKEKFDNLGVVVLCINGLLTSNENMFYKQNEFYDKMIKIISVSQLFGTKYIIFGSPTSRFVDYTERTYKYSQYQKCHDIFIRKLQEIGFYILEKGQVLIIKPNINSNYMNSDEIANSLVESVKLENVITGPMRTSIMNSHRDFDLLEYKGCDDIMMYHLLNIKLK